MNIPPAEAGGFTDTGIMTLKFHIMKTIVYCKIINPKLELIQVVFKSGDITPLFICDLYFIL